LWVAGTDDLEVSDRLSCEVRWDAPPQTLALYLREGTAIDAGTTLRLLVDDADSGERLHAEELTLLVNWE
jgi:hypothetical protein